MTKNKFKCSPQIFNGINDNSPSISGRFCGTELPPVFESTGNTLMMRFVTDASVSNGGFLATYTSEYDRGLNDLNYVLRDVFA